MNDIFHVSSNAPQLWQSVIFAWTFWTGLSLGAFGLMLLHNTVKGRFGFVPLRVWEAAAAVLPLMAAIFVAALFLGMFDLYPWHNPSLLSISHPDPILEHRLPYLNQSFFVVRTVAFFLFCIVGIFVLRGSSLRQDRTRDARLTERRANFAAPWGVLYFLMLTMASTDFFMSLDPHYYSTIFPVMQLINQCLSMAAFAALYVARNFGKEPYTADVVTRRAMNDIGNMMLLFTMFWAYFNLSQFLIQWCANLPQEISYYYIRTTGLYRPLSVFILIGQFFLPFVLLLSGRTKKTPAYLGTTAAFILFVRICDVFWMIMPMFRRDLFITGFDLLCFAGLGVVWYGAFRLALSRRPLLPQWTPAPVLKEVPEHA